MASDYAKIAADNVLDFGRRFKHYGKLISEQLYSDRTHFIFELLQNAEDALGRRIAREKRFDQRSVEFRLFRDRLELRHFGEAFDENDVRGICGVLVGTKSEDSTQIGRFGIGFKSVYAYTSSPEVHSGDEHFLIEEFIKPRAVEPRNLAGDQTLFVLPFDHEEVPPDEAFERIRQRLASLGSRTLLFLRHIDEISWTCEGEAGGTYIREQSRAGSVRYVTVIGQQQNDSQTHEEEWIVFERDVESVHDSTTGKVEAAFRLEQAGEAGGKTIVSARDSRLIVFFPTDKETHLEFLIQGPYKTTPARDNIAYPDDWNELLVRETANLIVEALQEIRDLGLLTVDFLKVLPIEPSNFAPGSPFRALFERVREALSTENLLPTQSGRHVPARYTRLAGTAGLRELIPDEQLDRLLASGRPLNWLPAGITLATTPILRDYLMKELEIGEITPDAFARRLGAVFMRHQTDEWVVRLYRFLDDQRLLWRPRIHPRQELAPLRSRPFIRLQDLSHVPPFQADDETPRAFLPIEDETELPTVRREVASDAQARQFLMNLGLTEPDIVDEVIEKILPKYRRKGSTEVEDQEHERDVRKIVRALQTDSTSKEERLLEALLRTSFLRAHNAATGTEGFRTPGSIYAPTPELERYFDRNPSAWFLDDGYDPYRSALFRLGVSTKVRISHGAALYETWDGHVMIADQHGWHVRGLNGFNPFCSIDGLEHALETITSEKAAFIWNVLLVPNSQHVRGVIESATLQDFGNAESEERPSVFGKLVMKHSWLPDRDGELRKPHELSLEDLPDDFARDEILGKALKMRLSDVALLAEAAGVSSEDISFMMNYSEEFERFKRQIEEREQTSEDGPKREDSTDDDLDYGKELIRTLTKPAREGEGEPPPLPDPVANPGLRRKRIRDEIEKTKREGPEKRFVRVPRKVWEAKNYEVRPFLREQYGGACQICTDTFLKRDGAPYFEGLYLVSSTRARWVDRPGNVLCLCATCCAKLQHGAVEAEDILEQVMAFRAQNEGGDAQPALDIRLGNEDAKILFTERHMIDLQEMVRSRNVADNSKE